MSEIVDNIAAYDGIADDWHAYRSGMPVNACVAAFAALLPKGAHVLDVGCGTGYPIDAYLIEHGFVVHGIDVSEAMLAYAAPLESSDNIFEQADIMTFETSETFDAVIAFDSLFHIDRARQADVYARIAAMLRPGGYLFFTHGAEDGARTGAMFGRTFYYAALDWPALEEVLRRCGLRVVDVKMHYEEPMTGSRDLIVTAQKE